MRLFIEIIKTRSWLCAQLATLLTLSGSSFIAIWFSDMGLTQSESLGILAILHGITAIPILLKNSKYYSRLFLLVSSIALILSVNSDSYVPIAICTFVAALQCSRDLFYIELMKDYRFISENSGATSQSTIALSMLIGIIAISILLPVSGLISALDGELYFIATGAIGVALTAALKSTADERKGREEGKVGLKIDANATHWLSAVALLSNGSVFFTRYFVVPSYILEMSSQFGLKSNALPIVGTAIGIVSVIGVLFRNSSKSTDQRSVMFLSFFVVMLACALVAVSNALRDPITSILTFAVGFVLLEIFCKIWTISYVANFKDHAEDSGNEKRAYSLYARYKAVGAFASFALAFAAVGRYEIVYIILFQVLVATTISLYIWAAKRDHASV